MQTPRSFGTHSGTFHADEVTACSLLLLYNLIDRDKIFRTRDEHLLSRCEYVCDVGGEYNPHIKRFDHHQNEYQGPLSSAGMILKYLTDIQHLSEKESEFLSTNLVQGIDAHDNGHDPLLNTGFCHFSHVISNFTPINYNASDVEQDMAFFLAVDFTMGHIRRAITRYRYHQSSREQVEQVMKNSSDCLLFENHIPWIDAFFELGGEHHTAQFVIMPLKNQWKLRGIPPNSREKMRVRTPLPQEWAGLLGDDLQKISGIEGAIFCHKGRFISMWQTKEAAVRALEKVLQGLL